jgi:hypothetical protein
MVWYEHEPQMPFERAVNDGSNPYYQGPERKPSTNIYRSIRPAIRELFPSVEKTQIPELIEQAIDRVSAYCKTDPDGAPHLIGRGSWIVRQILGTPRNYWDLTERFRNLSFDTELVGDSPLAQRVVEHAAEGPDIDVMYLLRDGVDDADVFDGLQAWVAETNTRVEPKGLRLDIEQVTLSGFNGSEDKRIYSLITFEKMTRYGWENVLRVDFGKEPKEHELFFDGRLSGYLPFHDAYGIADIQKRTDGRWRLRINKDNMDVLRYLPNRIHYVGLPPQILYTASARFLAHQVWWPKGEPLESFLYRQANVYRYTEKKYDVWQYPSFSFGAEAFYVRPDEGPLIQQREGDILGWYLLGMTADPYHWIQYARSIGVLQRSKLGEIYTPDVGEALLLEECSGRGYKEMKGFVHDFPNQVRAALARDYREHFSGLYLEYIGPVRFVRNLVTVGALSADTPVTIATFLDLVDPVPYLASLDVRRHGA